MKKFLLMCFSFGFAISVWAQDRVVTGKLTSKEDGSSLPGVNVVLKGSTTGTVSDADGNYKLTVPASGGTISFSFIGLETVDVEIGDRSVIDVTLGSDVTQLSEVVVTSSLGLVKQAKELGYAASTITAKELTQAKAVDVAQSLNGKISGVNITTANSGVFQNAKINIRGIRSLTGNNQPMLVVDGAQVPLTTLPQISPEDIADMTVLKSAASAALYGPDAVNGVIVVTTKRGKPNQSPTVSISSSIQASNVAFFPNLQHSFGQGAGEVVDAYGNYGYVPYENQLYGPRYDGTNQQIGVTVPTFDASGVQNGEKKQFSNYDNSHKNDKINFWNTGSIFQNSVSLTGSDYFLSVTDFDIKGLMPDDKNRRTTIRFSADKKVNKFSINYGLGYTLQKSDVVNENQLQNLYAGQYSGSIMYSVMQTADNIPLTSYKDQNGPFSSYSNWYNEFALPPYWIINNLRSKTQSNNLIANATLGYEITPWLKATARFNVNINDSRTDNTQNPLHVEDWTLKGPYARNSTQFFNAKGAVFNDMFHSSLFNVDYFLNGKRSIASNLTVNYLVGGNYREINEKDIALQGNNLVIPSLNNVSVRSGDATVPGYTYVNGSQIPYNPSSNYNYTLLTRRASAYGTVSFGYKDWAFVEFTGRNDWDSRLAASNRSFFYPAVNLSLVLSDAISSLKGNTLSFLKVRGAYAKSANVNINPYSLQATYTPPPGFPFGNNAGFTAGSTYPSPNLKPESIISQEIGIEAQFFNKLDFEATYFSQQCDDQVLNTTLPQSSGYTFGLANAASFKNQGVEMDLGIAPIQIGKGRISLKVNATYNTSNVTATPGGSPVIIGGSNNFIQRARSSPVANNIAVVGGPAFQFQLGDYVRDPATGKVVVDAVTGNPSLSTDLAVMGRTLPLWVFGFTPKYEIGGFSFSMTFDYKTGHQFFSGLGSDMDFSGISARSAQYGRQRFVFPNSVYKGSDGQYHDNTNIQIQDGNYGFWTGSSTNTAVATNYFASASAFRLREVNITYNVPQKWLSSTKFIKKISISAIGRNLLLYVPKSNQWGDPEFNFITGGTSSTQNTSGLGSTFQTPASRLYGGNLSITF